LKIISLLEQPMHKDDLIRQSNLGISRVHILISILETKSLVEQKFGKVTRRFPFDSQKFAAKNEPAKSDPDDTQNI